MPAPAPAPIVHGRLQQYRWCPQSDTTRDGTLVPFELSAVADGGPGHLQHDTNTRRSRLGAARVLSVDGTHRQCPEQTPFLCAGNHGTWRPQPRVGIGSFMSSRCQLVIFPSGTTRLPLALRRDPPSLANPDTRCVSITSEVRSRLTSSILSWQQGMVSASHPCTHAASLHPAHLVLSPQTSESNREWAYVYSSVNAPG